MEDDLGRLLRLLPTPAVNDMGRGKTPEQWDQWTDRMKAAHGNGNGHGASLEIEAQRLLPTPVADNSRGLPQPGTDYQSLPNAAAQDFAQYAPAITRWADVIGRPAPPPTTGHRLNPVFVEWMMGLPEEHVTGHASPAQALKMLGNGVVPQQAALALSMLDPCDE